MPNVFNELWQVCSALRTLPQSFQEVSPGANGSTHQVGKQHAHQRR
jgi:hypothetical protein